MRFAAPRIEREKRPDGAIVLRAAERLGPYDRAVGDWLVRWAERTPDHRFVAERAGDGWRAVTYGEAFAAVRRIAAALVARGLTSSTPVAILSENSVNHALLSLAAMHAGVPVAPISPAYSLVSKDYAKLKYIFDLVHPGLVYAEDPGRFAPALAAVGATACSFDELLDGKPSARLDHAFSAVGPGTVAKILFTSGSTGIPKGVINTQRMLCSNQQGWAQIWPFLEERPPVLCDWLPWNHTFGGNATFNLVLRNGGTMYVDSGRPMPGLIETTARNLAEVAPTLHFNVPRGLDLLVPLLENDAELRRGFFSRLEILFFAAAALPVPLWHRLRALVGKEGTGRPMLSSGWGSTETAPLAACVHYPIDQPCIIGNPPPGVELKLVPSGDKQEIRVRGPNVMTGYFRRPDLTRDAFDDEGFYKIGDAMKMADPEDAACGIVFDGRVAEDFKLSSGTWVHVGAVRLTVIAACHPLVQDAVITGHDRDEPGALIFVNPAIIRALGLDESGLRTRLREALVKLRAEATGGSVAPTRLFVLDEPPSIDGNEITDKGYINQSAVLSRRAVHVDTLHAGGPGAIVLET